MTATPKPYRTRVEDVPLVQGLREDEGWINMQVRFLIDEKSAGANNMVLGWTVMPPRASHDRHRHFHADEFLVVMSGAGVVFTDEGEEPARKGDVVFTPRRHWHGFRNDSDEEALLIWGWVGAGSLEAAGYEVPGEESDK